MVYRIEGGFLEVLRVVVGCSKEIGVWRAFIVAVIYSRKGGLVTVGACTPGMGICRVIECTIKYF